MKPKLIIWGGWWGEDRPLSLNTINSHASVSAYFLTKYLSEFYDIINIRDFYSAERIAEHSDAVAALSTYQRGFTRMIEKGEKKEFKKIRRGFKGNLCSVTDGVRLKRYKEDILFTINSRWSWLGRLANRDIILEKYGWPADPEICFPENVPDNEMNVFVDHSWYREKTDCSSFYFDAFKDVAAKPEYSNLSFNIYRQNNDGIVKWDLKGKFEEPLYIRSKKVPYLDILKVYRRCHIFCVTHPESAGLAAIEAAMCGAKLYIPSNLSRGTFISKEILKDSVCYTAIGRTKKSIISALESDIKKGFDRDKLHESLLGTNTWKKVAAGIHSVLSEKAQIYGQARK